SDGGYELLEIDSSKNFKTLEQAINYLKNNLAPDKIDDLYSQVQMAIQTGQSTQADIQMKLPSGKLIYHACQFNPVHDAQGHVQTIVGTFQDITDRTLSSKARKKAERELEEQRSLSMRSDRLRSLGEMSAGIAHELNQPLMGVRGLAEHIGIAIERGWDLPLESLKEQAGKIVEQADRMTHIIDHIRMFAREAAKPQSQPVSVNTVVDYAIDMLYAQFRSHGLSLVSDKVEDLPIVSANPFSIEEVLINLMINARHAVEEKVGEDQLHLAPEICVRTFQIDNDTVAIEVQDGGNGIPEDILDQVFDPFFTTKDPDKGTGLGLAISKSIVESFDGSIDIQSEPGQGTTVRISLPVSLPQTPAQ
ncbi:MAG: ATP-binding protein, partial [Candidatus Latescibacteria bacterium]|nr:ATP-binding protein [Candidatus Latescibacterota bacterium]